MKSLRFASICAAFALALPASTLPGLAQVSMPMRGVICDQQGQVCYDTQGLSLGLTQQYFGNQAVQNLMNQLRGGPSPKEFRLSNGVACSSVVRTCWSDGWNRTAVDPSLTYQLYGSSASGSSNGSSVTPEQAGGFCTINRSGMQLFSGGCQLKKITKGNKTRFEAALANGQTFSFVSRDGNFVIQDNTGGAWPVQFENRGTTGVFRWSDFQLIATRTTGINGGGPGQSALGNAAGAAIGAGIGALLNSLFR